ncbi:MAG: type II toxin-antitoxin system Phd/YefM family antitoxin [Deltaproteobacteria bacterium]|nr:MAG: type II toxin-antitoxin system Phd/YefM family antitoxin [Deltaproteobacteria bacterium]
MNTVGSYEAKTHLPKLLERVAKGERIIITRHGTPVAVLGPVPSHKKADIKIAIKELRNLRQSLTLSGLSVRELIDEGRRF